MTAFLVSSRKTAVNIYNNSEKESAADTGESVL